MVHIKKLCRELARVGTLTEYGSFNININGRVIKTMRSKAVCFSDYIQEKCINNKSTSSFGIYLNLKCEDSIDILTRVLETGILDFQEDEEHLQDMFEIGKSFGNKFLGKL